MALHSLTPKRITPSGKEKPKMKVRNFIFTLPVLFVYLFHPLGRAQTPSGIPVFKITPVKSVIKFAVKASVAIEGTFTKWDATLTYTSNHVEDGVLDIKIEAASVDTGSGMKDGKLKSKAFFDVEED